MVQVFLDSKRFWNFCSWSHSGMFPSDIGNVWHFLTWFQYFSTQLTLFSPKSSIGLKKDWIHVRKCEKFPKSSCRSMFSHQNKTLGNIPLWKGTNPVSKISDFFWVITQNTILPWSYGRRLLHIFSLLQSSKKFMVFSHEWT